MKQCHTCKIHKPLDCFNKNKSKKDGHGTECRECAKIYKKQYRQTHKEKLKEDGHNYYIKNKNEPHFKMVRKNYKKKYEKTEKGKAEKSRYGKRYRAKNRNKCIAYSKSYYQMNKDELREQKREYRHRNKNRVRAYRRQYEKDRMAKDTNFKLRSVVRSMVRRAVKRGAIKSKRSIELLGCSIEQFKEHIEGQFIEGMSWHNHGEWHIDHIIPLASFNLTDTEQLFSACHYTNYQPLWAQDNWKKGAK